MKYALRMSAAEIRSQLKKLGTDWNASSTNLSRAAERQLIPQPELESKPRLRKTYAPETAAEIHAFRELCKKTGMHLDQVCAVRELARKLYDVVPRLAPDNFNRLINQLTDHFEGKEYYAVPVWFWHFYRRWALIDLYNKEAYELEFDHPLWCHPRLMTDFIANLCRGDMRRWKMNIKREIIKPESTPPAPRVDDALTAPIAERSRPTATTSRVFGSQTTHPMPSPQKGM